MNSKSGLNEFQWNEFQYECKRTCNLSYKSIKFEMSWTGLQSWNTPHKHYKPCACNLLNLPCPMPTIKTRKEERADDKCFAACAFTVRGLMTSQLT